MVPPIITCSQLIVFTNPPSLVYCMPLQPLAICRASKTVLVPYRLYLFVPLLVWSVLPFFAFCYLLLFLFCSVFLLSFIFFFRFLSAINSLLFASLVSAVSGGVRMLVNCFCLCYT